VAVHRIESHTILVLTEAAGFVADETPGIPVEEHRVGEIDRLEALVVEVDAVAREWRRVRD
jgi:hypothetical protein